MAARSGSARVEVAVRLDDPDVGRLAPQPRRPVERADDDRDEQQDEAGAEPGRAEDLEELGPLHEVDDRRSEHGVVAGVDVRHLADVVGRPGPAWKAKPGSWRMVMPLDAMITRTMIWRTAKSTFVKSRHSARPTRAGAFEPRRTGGAREIDRRRGDDGS